METIIIEVIRMKKKIELFLKRNGFLTLLFLCVCFVAGATLFLATRDLGTGSEDLDIVDNEDFVNLDMDDLTDADLNREIFNYDVATNEDEEEPEPDESEEEEFEEEAEVAEEEEIEIIESEPRASSAMVLPVEGAIITEFVADSLIYSETLNEWRAHLGIDIQAPLNTRVKAPLGGIVKSVYEDELWGKVIVIDHGNGLESKLANLGTLEMVREGLEVSQGDHIATVGKSAKIELLMEEHLHFEVIKDGKNIDPRSIMH